MGPARRRVNLQRVQQLGCTLESCSVVPVLLQFLESNEILGVGLAPTQPLLDLRLRRIEKALPAAHSRGACAILRPDPAIN